MQHPGDYNPPGVLISFTLQFGSTSFRARWSQVVVVMQAVLAGDTGEGGIATGVGSADGAGLMVCVSLQMALFIW